MRMNNQRKRRRRATSNAVRIGLRLGLLVLTAYLTVRLCTAGIEALESRTGAPGGEIFILPLIILLIWTGWTARKEYADLKKGDEKKHEFRRSQSIPYSSQR